MRFLDSAKIWVQSGHGGAGAASFRREKFIEFGGPNGGDGGRGGHVIAVADPALNTLIDFRYRQHFKAKPGQAGMKQERTGKGGEDIRLRLPVGTQIYAEDGETLLADLLTARARRSPSAAAATAGAATSTSRPRPTAPRAVPSPAGRARSAGSGSSSSSWPMPAWSACPTPASRPSWPPSAAPRPRSPTTRSPRSSRCWARSLLGDDSFVIADIPGLIEGASEGKGLGDRFLGHIERCAALIHLVDATQEDVVGAWRTIRRELDELRPGPDRQARAALPVQDRRADRPRSSRSSGASSSAPPRPRST